MPVPSRAAYRRRTNHTSLSHAGDNSDNSSNSSDDNSDNSDNDTSSNTGRSTDTPAQPPHASVMSGRTDDHHDDLPNPLPQTDDTNRSDTPSSDTPHAGHNHTPRSSDHNTLSMERIADLTTGSNKERTGRPNQHRILLLRRMLPTTLTPLSYAKN
jgi:hypothetical protein